MNIQRLVQWAGKVLKHSPDCDVRQDSPIAKLRASLGKLPECQLFIDHFLRDAIPLLECQKIIKSKGLSWRTYEECKKTIERIPESSQVRIGFTVWMENQLIVSQKLGMGNIGLPVCSDNIESLFGIGKTQGIGEIKDANRIAERLPAFCGQLTEESARMVMSVEVKQQQAFEQNLLSLIKQRRDILPKPGTLTEDLFNKYDQTLSLIPVPKVDKKSNNSIDIIGSYNHDPGPEIIRLNPPNVTNISGGSNYSIAS